MTGERLLRTVVTGVLGVAALGLSAPPATAAGPVAVWLMNEAPGSSVMHDSSGNGIDAPVGSRVQTGVAYGDGAVAYLWSKVDPATSPVDRGRLIQVDDDRLNPRRAAFAVSLRFWSTSSGSNIVQKGQARTSGGQFKIELENGRVGCAVRGSAGTAYARTSASYTDGAWHTVRCERVGDKLTLTVTTPSGQVVETVRRWRSTGRLANGMPFTIGGKLNCDQVKVECDYFSGGVDWVRFELLS